MLASVASERHIMDANHVIIGGPHRVQIVGFDAPPISGAVPAEGETEPKPLF